MPGGFHPLTLSKGKPEERYHQQADTNSEPLVPSHKLSVASLDHLIGAGKK